MEEITLLLLLYNSFPTVYGHFQLTYLLYQPYEVKTVTLCYGMVLVLKKWSKRTREVQLLFLASGFISKTKSSQIS